MRRAERRRSAATPPRPGTSASARERPRQSQLAGSQARGSSSAGLPTDRLPRSPNAPVASVGSPAEVSDPPASGPTRRMLGRRPCPPSSGARASSSGSGAPTRRRCRARSPCSTTASYRPDRGRAAVDACVDPTTQGRTCHSRPTGSRLPRLRTRVRLPQRPSHWPSRVLALRAGAAATGSCKAHRCRPRRRHPIRWQSVGGRQRHRLWTGDALRVSNRRRRTARRRQAHGVPALQPGLARQSNGPASVQPRLLSRTWCSQKLVRGYNIVAAGHGNGARGHELAIASQSAMSGDKFLQTTMKLTVLRLIAGRAFVSLSLTGCLAWVEPTPTGPALPSGLVIRPSWSAVQPNGSVQLEAALVEANGDTVPLGPVEWSARSGAVTVDPAGRATALRVGVDTVIGSLGDSGGYAIVVVGPPVLVGAGDIAS